MSNVTVFSMKAFTRNLVYLRWQVATCETKEELEKLWSAHSVGESQEIRARAQTSNKNLTWLVNNAKEEEFIRYCQKEDFSETHFEELFNKLLGLVEQQGSWNDVPKFALWLGVVVGTAGDKLPKYLDVMQESWRGDAQSKDQKNKYSTYFTAAVMMYAYYVLAQKGETENQDGIVRTVVGMVDLLSQGEENLDWVITTLWAGDNEGANIVGVGSFLNEADPATCAKLAGNVKAFLSEKVKRSRLKTSLINRIDEKPRDDQLRNKIRNGDMGKYL